MASSSTTAAPGGAAAATHMQILGGDNYNSWLIRINDLFVTKGINVDDSTSAALIRQHCDDSYLPIIGKLKTGKEILAALEKCHNQKAQSSAFVNVKSLIHIKKGDGESLFNYVSRAQGLREILEAGGEKFSDLVFITHLLEGLPEGYNDVKHILVNLDDKLTMESILPKLMAQEIKLKTNQSDDANEAHALAAWAIKNKNKNKQNKPRQDDASSFHESGGLCDFCGRNNHTADKCKFRERWENGGSAAYYAKHPQARMAAVVKQPSTEEILHYCL